MIDPFASDEPTSSAGDVTPPRPLRPGDLTEAVPLRDALSGIGEVMQLPRKRPTAPGGMAAIAEPERSDARTLSRNTKTIGMPAVPAPPAPASERARLGRWVGTGALAVVAGVALFATLFHERPRHDPMPSALRQEWRTEHPDYAHAAIAFTDSTVTIVTRDLASADPDRPILQRHRLVALEATPVTGGTEVVVRYLVDGEPDQIEALLASGLPPTLSFRHPEGLLWTPVPAGAP